MSSNKWKKWFWYILRNESIDVFFYKIRVPFTVYVFKSTDHMRAALWSVGYCIKNTRPTVNDVTAL